MFPCFRVLGGPQGPVFCVFVFWAGTTGLCFVFSCFGRPPSKHSTGPTGSSTLCSLGLPPHVGRGDAAVVRPTRSESFFDLIT